MPQLAVHNTDTVLHPAADAAEMSNMPPPVGARRAQVDQDTGASDSDYSGMCGDAAAIHRAPAAPHLSVGCDYNRVVPVSLAAAAADA